MKKKNLLLQFVMGLNNILTGLPVGKLKTNTQTEIGLVNGLNLGVSVVRIV